MVQGVKWVVLDVGRVCVCVQFYFFYATVTLGVVPGKDTLTGVPLFSKESGSVTGAPKESQESSSARVAQKTNTLMSLIKAHESLNAPSKSSRVWLGEGLGAIPKRVHECMLRWEFIGFLPPLLVGPSDIRGRHGEAGSFTGLRGFATSEETGEQLYHVGPVFRPLHSSDVETLPELHRWLHEPPTDGYQGVQ